MAVLRVPLSAGYPVAGELLAIQVMVVTQVTAAALLFPWLLRDRSAAVAVMATAWPFVVIAGVMSATPGVRVAAAGCYVGAWIAALWMWKAFNRATGDFAAVAISSLMTVGALVLFYLRLEFAPAAAADAVELARAWTWASPPLAALKVLAEGASILDWCAPALVFATACARGGILWRSRQLIHRR